MIVQKEYRPVSIEEAKQFLKECEQSKPSVWIKVTVKEGK